jgi:hypothetical protein
VIYFKALSRHSLGGTEEDQENLDQVSWCAGLTQHARYEFHLVSIHLLAVITISNRNALAIREQDTHQEQDGFILEKNVCQSKTLFPKLCTYS